MNHVAQNGQYITVLKNPGRVFNYWRGFTSAPERAPVTHARSREMPRPFRDTRPVAPAQTPPALDYVELQKTLGRRNYMVDNTHGAGGGGGSASGASFANWAMGILAVAAAFFIVVAIVGAVINSSWPNRSNVVLPVTTTDPPYVVTPGNQACKPFLVEMKSNGAAIWSVPDGCPR